MKEAVDRGEGLALMEPMLLAEQSPQRPGLNDLALELAAASAGFRRSLPAGVVKALADLVRAMNCYYSNLEFTRYFLEVCLDQVRFMEQLVQPDRLRERILLWVEEEVRTDDVPAKAGQVLEAILYRGELPRGDVAGLLGTSDRQARRVVSALLHRGVLASESTRAPLLLAFPAALAGRWMPGLFPEQLS